MNSGRPVPTALLAICVLLQSSCGGGGGSLNSVPPPPPPPSGLTLSVTRAFPSLPAFDMPVGALQVPGDASRWFVVEQSGHIRVFDNQANVSAASDFLDLSAKVACCGETGLLGVAFHPGFPTTDTRVYVSYTALVGAQLVSRLAQYRSTDGGATLDATTETILIEVNQPEANHKGGHVVFGNDGFLYFGLGDGGGGGDMHGTIGNGQNLNTLLGKMLRIDVDSAVAPYGIPADNPYPANANCGATGGTGTAPCAEIYAWGLRNPWQYSFDSTSGALWIGDVGQDAWEEVDRVTAPGVNLGWRCREGAHVYNSSCGPATDLTDPVAEYSHSLGNAITGGFVYRGSQYPALVGQYVCADYVSGRLFHFDAATSAGSTLEMTSAGDSGINPSSFGQDMDGELYLLDYGSGAIYALVATS
jgi:glucose/arabinose dehydrogenase